ncbi:ATP-binding protein [Rhodoferax sp.]|uniref:ATP-binding protein n=1 Tax=Rhodoferax sp. TaxID=50421 RepID=UPI002622E620|nr:ATP-binding protein [Rhodoferax sp.]
MPMLASHYRRTLWLLWLAAACLVGLSWWHTRQLIADSQHNEFSIAERDLSNLTRVTQEHANRTFRNADQVIRFIQARYLEQGNKLNLTALTQQGVIDTEIFPQVGIIDAKGIYILANRPITGRLDLSDREHFKVHLGAGRDKLFISKPVLGRATGKWSIQLTRPITLKNGQFGGVVVVSIDPGYFTRFYGELELGADGLLALYGQDGIARARKVGEEESFGNQASNTPMWQRIGQGQASGSYTRASSVDGVERLFFFRQIPGYDLAVVAGRTTQNVLQHHQDYTANLRQQTSLMSLLILALAAALSRTLGQIRREMLLRQQAQQQIEDRNQQLSAIFELSPDGFVSFDARKRVKYISRAFSELTCQGQDVLDNMDEHDFATWLAQRCNPETPFMGMAALRAQALQTQTSTTAQAENRVLIELNQGCKRVLQLGLRLSHGSTVSQILYLRDVTYETEVDSMKSEFLATAAHELRTPMASIFGYAELLLNDTYEAPLQRECLATIHQQSKLMTNILNELLDLARIEARRGKDFRYTRVDLQDLLTELCKSYPLPAGRSAPALELPAQPLYLMADAGKLRQALLNVVSNAYKYSPKGGAVSIQARLLALPKQPPMVCIDVTDHGIGLTPEQIKRVCERFYRANTSGKILGTGLGMSIVKEIIELHHGQLSIDSAPGQGTTVHLCLPTYTTASARQNTAHPADLG